MLAMTEYAYSLVFKTLLQIHASQILSGLFNG